MEVDVRKDPETARKYKAMLNGQIVKYAVAASEEEGWVEFYVVCEKPNNGTGLIPKQHGSGFVSSSAYGTVRLIPVMHEFEVPVVGE